ncbi:hypothetical protein [Streptomyces sp. NPDC057199]
MLAALAESCPGSLFYGLLAAAVAAIFGRRFLGVPSWLEARPAA